MIHIDNLEIQMTSQGLFGRLSLPLQNLFETIEQATKDAYLKIFDALKKYSNLNIVKFWNCIPSIVEVYQSFNAGRYAAFTSFYGESLERRQPPVASAIGIEGNVLTIEFLAVSDLVCIIENKDQVPSSHYSKAHGEVSPFFSRGVIYKNKGQHILLSAGTASVVGELSVYIENLHEQLAQSFQNLRVLGSQPNLKKYNIHYSFTLEDIISLKVYYKHSQDKFFLERWIPKFLSKTCKVSFQQVNLCRNELLVELEASFVKKGEYEDNRLKYFLDEEQRIVTESMEIHITEHCNLKCRDCCNMSPYNSKIFMKPEEVLGICDFVKLNFRPNMFKICGGEPTLHPKIDEILKIIRQSEVSEILKVITNGLMLFKMSDTFWRLIDQLTISNYISAPIRPKLLQVIKEKAKQFDVMLNIKYVDQFNEIFVEDAIIDKERTQDIYNDCWMRHVCLIIRNGYFHKCTRSSYMDKNLKLVNKSYELENSSFSCSDGIKLSDPNFKDKALIYLNNTKPLNSCRHCLGVSGNLRPNIQLKNVTQF